MKNKFVIDWEIEEKFKKSMMETIQEIQVVNPPPYLPTPSTRQWTTS